MTSRRLEVEDWWVSGQKRLVFNHSDAVTAIAAREESAGLCSCRQDGTAAPLCGA